jgi:hypothetical protein
LNASRRRTLSIALSAVCLSGLAYGAEIATPAGSGGASFSPAAVQSWTSAIGAFFGSSSPDLMTLRPLLASVKGVDLADPATRAALAPVFASVYSQVQALQTNAVAAPGANPALAAKLVAADILADFQLPETRSRVAALSRAYHDALPPEKKEEIRAQLLLLDMKSMAAALGRTSVEDARTGIAAADAGGARFAAPASWRLQPSEGGIRGVAADYKAGPSAVREINALLAGASAVSGKPALEIIADYKTLPGSSAEAKAVLAAAAALSGKPLREIVADYDAIPALTPELRAGLAAAAAISGKPLAGILSDFKAGPVSSPEIRMNLAAAAAISGVPLGEISADYGAAPKSSAETRAVLAAAAALSGKPLSAVVADYTSALASSPDTRAILVAAADDEGKLTTAVIADYITASTPQIRAHLAAAAAISGKPLETIITDYVNAPASTPQIRASLASAAAFSRTPHSRGRMLFIQLPQAAGSQP